MLQPIKRPTPIDEEVLWDKSKVIVSSTDIFGTITYANDIFSGVCGYSNQELIGQPHNIIRHPDMPQILFKVLWDNLLEGRNFHAIVKNLSKSGRYYWVITDFNLERNSYGRIHQITAYRRAVPKDVIDEHISPLYATLLKLETIGGMELSNRYLKGFLTKHNATYVELIMSLMGNSVENANKNLEFTNLQLSENQEVNMNNSVSDDIYNESKTDEAKQKSFFTRLFQN